MKKFVVSLLMLCVWMLPTLAQEFAGDKILGEYWVNHGDEKSKVRFTKIGTNAYRAQVTWLEKIKDAKGNIRRDPKNPDPSKRNIPADQMVLIDKVSYKDGEWAQGEIYDPTRGRSFTVCIWFKDDETLCVKGSWGPFSQKIYWPRVK